MDQVLEALLFIQILVLHLLHLLPVKVNCKISNNLINCPEAHFQMAIYYPFIDLDFFNFLYVFLYFSLTIPNTDQKT
jgi:hypothetical protein